MACWMEGGCKMKKGANERGTEEEKKGQNGAGEEMRVKVGTNEEEKRTTGAKE